MESAVSDVKKLTVKLKFLFNNWVVSRIAKAQLHAIFFQSGIF